MNGPRSRIRNIGPALALTSILMSAACTTLGIVQREKDRPLAEAIQGRKRVRVFTPEGPTQVLRPAVISDGLEGLAPKTREPIRFALADIRSVQIRTGGPSRGAQIGAGLGFAAGLAAGAILTQASGDGGAGDPDLSGAGVIVVGGLVGAAAGALAGALIGSPFHGWKTVYRANSGAPPVPMISLAPTRGGGLAATFAVAF